MFSRMSRENAQVSQGLRDSMREDLQGVYSQNLESISKQWYGMQHSDVGKATQEELLRFRGSSSLQAAVWDNNNSDNSFYTYDLLRFLPYALVEVIDRDTFLEAASKFHHGEEEFPQKYIQVYLRIQEWVEKRFDLSLYCNRKSSEINSIHI